MFDTMIQSQILGALLNGNPLAKSAFYPVP